jgi:hypothetical protein
LRLILNENRSNPLTEADEEEEEGTELLNIA